MDDDSAPLPLPPLAARPSREVGPTRSSPLQTAYAIALRGLPALLLTLAAAGTWWMLRQAAPAAAPDAVETASSEPDYEMRRFSVRRASAGSARIEGDYLRHFPDSDLILIDQVRVLLEPADGSELRAQAPSAQVHGTSKDIELRGGAVVERRVQPGQTPLRLETERLLINTEQRTMSSRDRVTLRQGFDEVSADQLQVDQDAATIELRGAVRGRIGGR